MHYDAIIIGAGMSGLGAGIRLAMYDKKVVVLERHYVWGGLNSFYQFQGHQFDVGLHAMTNYAPRGAKGLPLTRLLKQLRIRWDELDLHEQGHSAISWPGEKLKFSNDFELLRSEVSRAFPSQADGFDALTQAVRDYNELDLDAPTLNAREIVEQHITDPVLADMLFCPLMYYGSARENDMDWDQFVVMFKSIYFEGFSRPQAGVRHILKLLIDRYRKAGGELRLKTGVSRIITEGQRTTGVELDSGETLTADTVLSSAGLVETRRMLESQPIASAMEHGKADVEITGKLSFTETINVLDRPAREIGIDATIIFFNNTERFNYAQPTELCDTSSGVICIPGNFKLPDEPNDHLVRITNIANFDKWDALDRGVDFQSAPVQRASSPQTSGKMPDDHADIAGNAMHCPGNIAFGDSTSHYHAAKREWYSRSCEDVLTHIPDFRPHTTLTDMFTPRTICHYTGHEGGAVYGSPIKKRTGESGIDGLYIIGTDQGFLGIIGAMLSGISMANRWVLQRDSATVEMT